MRTEQEIKDYMIKIQQDIIKFKDDKFMGSGITLWQGWIQGLEWVLTDVEKCPTCGQQKVVTK